MTLGPSTTRRRAAEVSSAFAIARGLGGVDSIPEPTAVKGTRLADPPFELVSEILESTTDGVYVVDRAWRFIYQNPVARRDLPRKVPILGCILWDVYPELKNLAFWEETHRAMDDRIPSHFQQYYPLPIDRCYEVHAYPNPYGMAVFFRDITDQKAEEERLRLFEQAIASAPVGFAMASVDKSGSHPMIYVNPAFERLTGYSAEEALGKDCRFLQGSDRNQEGRQEVRTAIEGGLPAKVLLRNYKKNGRQFANELHLSQVRDTKGNVTHLVGIQNDVTEQLEIKERLARQAKYDALTGVANRYLLIERLGEAIVAAEAEQSAIAVIILDLDNFKHINDSLGHMEADHLLVQISSLLNSLIGVEDTVARLGGDEFAIVIRHASDQARLLKCIEKILAEIRRPVLLGSSELMVTASIGVALFPGDAVNADDLLLAADLSMYSAKRRGKNLYRFYTPSLRLNRNEPLDIAVGLKKAIVNGEFELFFQPRVSARTNEILSLEALIRWKHPTRGLLMPAQFIGVAEDTGIIHELGQWSMEEAIRQNAKWRQAGLKDISISVNVSPAQMRDPHFPTAVADILSEAGLSPEALEIELTESLLIDNAGVAEVSLCALKELGVKIAIDDFGSGYSGLHYLSRFPVDTIKIDHFFTGNIAHDKTSATICRSIIKLGQQIGLTTVAEGVETREQAVLLRSWRCTELQGHLFASPLSGRDAAEMLRHPPAGPVGLKTSAAGEFRLPQLNL